MSVYTGIKLGTHNFYCSQSPVLVEQSVLLKLWGIPQSANFSSRQRDAASEGSLSKKCQQYHPLSKRNKENNTLNQKKGLLLFKAEGVFKSPG